MHFSILSHSWCTTSETIRSHDIIVQYAFSCASGAVFVASAIFGQCCEPFIFAFFSFFNQNLDYRVSREGKFHWIYDYPTMIYAHIVHAARKSEQKLAIRRIRKRTGNRMKSIFILSSIVRFDWSQFFRCSHCMLDVSHSIILFIDTNANLIK